MKTGLLAIGLTTLDVVASPCVIKDGARGSYVVLPGGRQRLPAHVITPVDTTSCGDAFCAGFIAALDQAWTPLDACRFAGMAAGLVAEGVGTLGALLDFDATVAAMTRYQVAVEPAQAD